jgi:hypothetical protein
MTRLGCRTQARRVFRQGNGINPHFQHTPQYFPPICRCSGMCKTSLLDVDTVRGTDELGWESRRHQRNRRGEYPMKHALAFLFFTSTIVGSASMAYAQHATMDDKERR